MLRIRSAILLLLVPISIASATGPNAFRPHAVDWMETLYVPAYDAGPDGPDVPRAVVLRYQRWTSASGSVENMDAQACGVVFLHEVRLELSLVGGRVLDVSTRVGSEARMLGPFDGKLDYAGASGEDLWSAEGATTALVLDDPADIAWFTGGPAGVPLLVVATGEAGFAGPESLHQDAEVRAGVRLTVEYLTD